MSVSKVNEIINNSSVEENPFFMAEAVMHDCLLMEQFAKGADKEPVEQKIRQFVNSTLAFFGATSEKDELFSDDSLLYNANFDKSAVNHVKQILQ